MADTTEELAALNDNARILMEKYDGAFTKLDESADEKVEEITTTATTKKTEIEKLGTAKKDEILQTADESIETIKDLAEPTKVLSNPVVTLPAKVTAGYSANINLDCESYLVNASISEYEITILDEMTIVVATDNVANFTHTFDGEIGDIVSLKVKAKDTLGNYSDTVSVDIELVENMPPSIPTVSGIDETGISQNATFSINFTGSTDDDGDSITYKVVDSGAFTFSKTTDIAEAESIDVTAPEVTEDTTYTFSVVAVDSNGMQSDLLSVDILVKDAINVSYNTVDIFSDGSCIFYAPFNDSTDELTGSYEVNQVGSLTTTADGLLNDSVNDTNAINFRGLDLPDEFSFSAFIQETSDANTSIVTAIEFRNVSPAIYGGNCTGTDGKRSISFGYADGSDGIGVVEINYGDKYNVVYCCKKIDNDNYHATCYLNGEKVIDEDRANSLFSDTTQRVLFFQEGDGTDDNGWDKGFDASQCFIGYIKNFRIFNRLLTDDEAQILSKES